MFPKTFFLAALVSSTALQAIASPVAGLEPVAETLHASIHARQDPPRDTGILIINKPPNNTLNAILAAVDGASRFCQNWNLNYGTASPNATTWLGNNMNCRFWTQRTDCSGPSTFIYAVSGFLRSIFPTVDSSCIANIHVKGNDVREGTFGNIAPKSFVCQFTT